MIDLNAVALRLHDAYRGRPESIPREGTLHRWRAVASAAQADPVPPPEVLRAVYYHYNPPVPWDSALPLAHEAWARVHEEASR